MLGVTWVAIIAALSGIIGAGLGALGSIYVATLQLKGREDYFDERAIKFLKSKFEGHEGGLSWGEISKYGKTISLSADDTRQLLLLADIEPTDKDGTQWKPKQQ